MNEWMNESLQNFNINTKNKKKKRDNYIIGYHKAYDTLIITYNMVAQRWTDK